MRPSSEMIDLSAPASHYRQPSSGRSGTIASAFTICCSVKIFELSLGISINDEGSLSTYHRMSRGCCVRVWSAVRSQKVKNPVRFMSTSISGNRVPLPGPAKMADDLQNPKFTYENIGNGNMPKWSGNIAWLHLPPHPWLNLWTVLRTQNAKKKYQNTRIRPISSIIH